MPTAARRLLAAVMAALVASAIAACGIPVPTPGRPGEPVTPPPVTVASPTPSPGQPTPSPQAELTPVPGGASGSPEVPGRPATTVTEWGTILDRVPEGFPVYPGAAGTDPIEGPASGAWEVVAEANEVADWYVAAFEELGWSMVDLGSPLEDGTQVLDLASDLPECRVQVTFRPLGGSTMISVLYGAGCAGGDG